MFFIFIGIVVKLWMDTFVKKPVKIGTKICIKY